MIVVDLQRTPGIVELGRTDHAALHRARPWAFGIGRRHGGLEFGRAARDRRRLAQAAGIVEIDADGVLGLLVGVIADHMPVHHAVEQRHDVIRLEVQARHGLGRRVLREGLNGRQAPLLSVTSGASARFPKISCAQ